ncbi:MAG: hypothetical protein OEV44_11080 [Spirochaetota bacterium]|nr:hypothetical protein [Spirochaetota bacterium]
MARYTTRIYWENFNGEGIVTATLRKENGAEHELYQRGVKLSRAENVGERLLAKLKALY